MGRPGSIEWVANHSRNTQIALFYDYIDIALTYERDQEALAESEGWSVSRSCLFHDHFVVAGPYSDPAGIRATKSPAEALERIAETRSPYHSRQDGSATMWKEAELWTQVGVSPWTKENDADWFEKSDIPPAKALQQADAAGAYLITDRSTILRQTGLGTISHTTVFFEPVSEEDVLMNSCYALCSPDAARDTSSQVNHFIQYALSKQGQCIIASHGLQDSGLPLFATVEEKFARARLNGGYPEAGKWVAQSSL